MLVCYCFRLLHLKKTNHVIVFPVFRLIGEYIFLDLSILSTSPAVVRSFLKADAIVFAKDNFMAVLICRFSSHCTNPSPVMHVFVVCMCVCVCERERVRERERECVCACVCARV